MLCQPNCSWVSAKPTDCQQGGPAQGCCARLHLLTSAHLEQLCSQSGSRCCWWVCGSGCPLTGGCVKLCLVVALSAQLRPLSPTVPLKPRDGCQGKEDLHQQSYNERWLLASGKFSLFLKTSDLMLGGHLTDVHFFSFCNTWDERLLTSVILLTIQGRNQAQAIINIEKHFFSLFFSYFASGSLLVYFSTSQCVFVLLCWLWHDGQPQPCNRFCLFDV